MSDIGKGAIQKLAALIITGIAIFLQLGFWAALSSDYGNTYPATYLLHYPVWHIDPFIFLTTVSFVGFAILWTILILQGRAMKEPLVTLLITLAIAASFSIIVVNWGTLKGWFWMGYVNTFVFGINALFALIYIPFGKVK